MTRLFDFIHHHGCRIAEERAKAAEPDYAARHAARRVTPGVVLGTAGPGGLQGLFDDFKVTDKYRTWWHKATLHIHWWLQAHGPSRTRRDLKWFWQRGKRGWSDQDAWNFHSHMARVIRDVTLDLKQWAHGHPQNISYDQWLEVLQEISDGMQAAITLDQMDYDLHDPQVQQDLEDKHALAMDLLKTYWFHLWD